MRDSIDSTVLLTAVHQSFEEGGQDRTVLCGIEEEFAAGESVAILGRSGSGKSTLLHLIAGLDVPDRGSVTVAGVNLATLDGGARAAFRRRHIGFVFQSFHLLPTLTIGENVTLPLELERKLTTADRERIANLLSRVGLADRGRAFPDILSGGEQQRVAIARALASSPQLLLADEPTGNLDADTAESVLDLLFEVCREHNATIVMATHSLTAATRCDRVLRIDEGSLVAESLGPGG